MSAKEQVATTGRTLTSSEADARPACERDELPLVDPAHYRLGAELARGGTGRILEAVDLRLGRRVAIKEPLDTGPGLERRFVQEARVTSRLQHPAIIPVYEVGRWPSGVPFYAMKLVDGRTLRALIDATERFEDRLALLPHAVGVADAMAYAHAQRHIHRDLKPSNVLVGPFGETVVIDWGLAKDLGDTAAHADAPLPGARDTGGAREGETGETGTGAVLGTPAYMPPEQARGDAVDERADVYAIGALLYHLLAGALPYDGNPRAILAAVLAGPPVPLLEREPRVPRELAAVVDKAMQRDARARYPSAIELADDLRRYQAGQRLVAHRYSPVDLARRFVARHQTAFIAAALSLVALAVVLVLSVARIDDARRMAERERAEAQRAQAEAESRRDQLVLAQAENAVDADPTAALAWLKAYPADGPDGRRARAILDDARSRGAARHVFTGVTGAALSDDGASLALLDADGAVRLCDPATARCRTLVAADARPKVEALRFAPDATRLATARADGSVQLWDVATGAAQDVPALAPAAPSSLTFSPDGALLATLDGPRLRTWHVHTRQARVYTEEEPISFALFSADGAHVALQWKDDSRPGATLLTLADGASRDVGKLPLCCDVAFSADGHVLASGTARDDLELFDLRTGATRVLSGQDERLTALALSDDGRSMASMQDDEVWLWDLATGTHRVLGKHEGFVDHLLFTGAGHVASAAQDGTVRLWDLRSDHVSVLRGHRGFMLGLGFSARANLLLSLGSDGTARLWPVTPALSRAAGTLPDRVRDAAFSADGKRLGLASSGEARVCDVGDADDLAACRSVRGRVARLAFGPGDVVAVFGVEARLWDVRTNEERVLPVTSESFQAAAFSPDGALVAFAGGFDRTIHVFGVDDGKLRTALVTPLFTKAVEFSPKGDVLAFAGDAGHVGLWQRATGEVRALSGLTGNVSQIAWSPDGERLAASGEGPVGLWDTKSGAMTSLQGHTDAVFHVRFAPDGRTLATVSGDTTVRVWRLAPRGSAPADVTSRELKGHTGPVWRLAFSPDGASLATVSRDRTARLWDVATGEPRILRAHADDVRSVAFSPDGARLVTGSWDRTARLWDLTRDAPEARPVPRDATQAKALLDALTTAAIGDEEMPATTAR